MSYLFDQCKKHYIGITPPDNIAGFLEQLRKIKDKKQKAINLLLEEIQKDISVKEQFIQG